MGYVKGYIECGYNMLEELKIRRPFSFLPSPSQRFWRKRGGLLTT
jgi:hypothetical protein